MQKLIGLTLVLIAGCSTRYVPQGEGLQIKNTLSITSPWLKPKADHFDVNLLVENKSPNKIVISNVKCAAENYLGNLRFQGSQSLRLELEPKEVLNLIGVCDRASASNHNLFTYDIIFSHVFMEEGKAQKLLAEEYVLSLK